MKLLAVLVFSICYSTSVFGGVLDSADFESGQISSGGWRIYGNNKVSVTSSPKPVCEGEFSAEFLLNTNYPKNRTELVGGRLKNFEYDKNYWIGFAVYLDDGWKIDNSRASDEIIWQLHGAPDIHLGETYRKALLTLSASKDSWALRSGWCGSNSAKKVCSRNEVKKQSAKVGKLKPGKWTEFVLHIKVSYRNNGFIDVWKDGTHVVKMTGPNAFNDKKGPYMKFGMYKSSWGASKGKKASGFTTRKLFIDGLTVGDKNESFESVDPNCGKSTNSLEPPKSLSIK